MFLGRERGVWLRRRRWARGARLVLDELGRRGSRSDARVATLSVAQQQMVEIARALRRTRSVLILDEPTATLCRSRESTGCSTVVRQLRERGLGIVYISHRLDEIFAIADRVTVLRDGRRVLTTRRRVGPRRPHSLDGRTRRVEDFRRERLDPGSRCCSKCGPSPPPAFPTCRSAFDAGEIVGLAGPRRRRTHIGRRSRWPARSRRTARFASNGQPVHVPHSGRRASPRGVAYRDGGPQTRGLFPQLGVDANITLTYLSTFTRGGVIAHRRASGVRPPMPRGVRFARRTAGPAGGHAVRAEPAEGAARAIPAEPRPLVILDEPTRGVDVGARAEIYALMRPPRRGPRQS